MIFICVYITINMLKTKYFCFFVWNMFVAQSHQHIIRNLECPDSLLSFIRALIFYPFLSPLVPDTSLLCASSFATALVQALLTSCFNSPNNFPCLSSLFSSVQSLSLFHTPRSSYCRVFVHSISALECLSLLSDTAVFPLRLP